MYREAGIKPNFSDIAKRYGKDRHTVAAYWRAEGGRPRDGRADRAGSFDAHIEEVAAKAQLPGVTKKGIHEWLLHRYPGENLAGVQRLHPVHAQERHRRRGLRRPGTASALRDAARAAAAVRLEGVGQDGKPRRRAVRVQRVRGDAGPFPQAHIHPVGDQDDRRPGQMHVRHDREARRRAPRVGHGQHVRPGGDQGRQAPQGPARIRVRQGRRLRAEAVPPAQPPDQGQGRVVEPLPVAARGLPGRLRRLGRHRRDHRADRGRQQLRAQRDHGAAALRAVHGGEGRAAARRQPSRPRGGDGRRGARGQGAGHDAGERARRAHVGAQALHRQARPHRLHARRRDGLLRRRRAGGDARGGRAWTTRRTTPRPWPGSAGSATPPATSRRPPPPTSGCSTR